MTLSKLQFQTPTNSPLSMNIYSANDSFKLSKGIDAIDKNFQKLLEHPMSGFQYIDELQSQITACQKVYQKFKSRKYFIHIGMGGSVLGTEVIINALTSNNDNIIFLNNLDPDDIHQKLATIDLSVSVIYLVSKSGGTLETNLMMQILINQLKLHQNLKNKSEDELLKEYFIFATDPHNGKLRDISNKKQITSLEIPTNLGGRFCAFSAVTFLPALFTGIDVEKFYQGALSIKKYFDASETNKIILSISSLLVDEYHNGKNLTVLMPYSSLLKSFTHWFAQLWGESLGKKTSLNKNVGLTPLVAHGPADQHSLLQLFMEGPSDKCYFFIKIKNFKNHYSSFSDELQNKNLTQIVHAQLEGTMAALQKNAATMIQLEIEELNEFNLGKLMYFFEYLTVTTGAALSVDPFNQPGVESGKNLTWSILRDGNSPLLN